MVSVDDPLATKLLNTNFSKDRLGSLVTTSTKSSHQLEIRSFGPQSTSREKINAIQAQKKVRQSEIEGDVPEDKRSLANVMAMLFGIESSEDVITTCINFQTLKSLEFNLVAMGDKGPVVLQLFAHIRDAILKNKSYLKQYSHKMEWLSCMLCTSLQNILASFAELSEDFALMIALQAQHDNTILAAQWHVHHTEMLGQIVQYATAVKIAIEQAKFAQKALSPNEHCPEFYNAARNELFSRKDDATPSLDTTSLKEQKKRPVSASGERQSRASRFQTNTRLLPPSMSSSKKKDDQCGMIFLFDGDMPSYSVFPQDLTVSKSGKKKLCADFCCQKKMCRRSSCTFAHIFRYDHLTQEEFDLLCEHISKNKIGWLSDGMLHRSRNVISLNSKFSHLRGDANGPFAMQNEG
ncbi:hypothetical protein QTG54_016065 [Skeletonema marinoi]|uniref:C3H1-type domain-containing protein n=1 Tax=Skeletonema marinoi TaxID=267567 RepID=A0AAD8XT68_9STRA|nr:hypothetical protein QTG54_016065 [Skeletonema marinoi]